MELLEILGELAQWVVKWDKKSTNGTAEDKEKVLATIRK